MAEPYDQSYFVSDPPRVDGYTSYSKEMWGGTWTWDGFANTTQARALEKGFDITGRKVLIVGAGYGFMVEELVVNKGVDCYGMDISPWAVSQAPASIAARMIVGDARVRSNLTAARSLAGLSGNQRFDLIMSEDLLVCFSDSEASAAAQEWRTRHATQVGHRVTTHPCTGGYNIKTLAQWRALLGQQDWIWDYFNWTEG